MNNDIISRQALLDAVDSVDWYHRNKNGEMVHGANDDEHQAWYKADDIYKAIESVPSAQPDVPDTNVGELISRQAAIKALEETKQSDPFNRYEYQNIGIDWSIDVIKALPSAQPDVSDTNQSRGEVTVYANR